jgi:hypothetical protein
VGESLLCPLFNPLLGQLGQQKAILKKTKKGFPKEAFYVVL